MLQGKDAQFRKSNLANQEVSDASNGLCGGGNPGGTNSSSTRLPPLHSLQTPRINPTPTTTMDTETTMEGATCIITDLKIIKKQI
jgi:hypothetical protein